MEVKKITSSAALLLVAVMGSTVRAQYYMSSNGGDTATLEILDDPGASAVTLRVQTMYPISVAYLSGPSGQSYALPAQTEMDVTFNLDLYLEDEGVEGLWVLVCENNYIYAPPELTFTGTPTAVPIITAPTASVWCSSSMTVSWSHNGVVTSDWRVNATWEGGSYQSGPLLGSASTHGIPEGTLPMDGTPFTISLNYWVAETSEFKSVSVEMTSCDSGDPPPPPPPSGGTTITTPVAGSTLPCGVVLFEWVSELEGVVDWQIVGRTGTGVFFTTVANAEARSVDITNLPDAGESVSLWLLYRTSPTASFVTASTKQYTACTSGLPPDASENPCPTCDCDGGSAGQVQYIGQSPGSGGGSWCVPAVDEGYEFHYHKLTFTPYGLVQPDGSFDAASECVVTYPDGSTMTFVGPFPHGEMVTLYLPVTRAGVPGCWAFQLDRSLYDPPHYQICQSAIGGGDAGCSGCCDEELVLLAAHLVELQAIRAALEGSGTVPDSTDVDGQLGGMLALPSESDPNSAQSLGSKFFDSDLVVGERDLTFQIPLGTNGAFYMLHTKPQPGPAFAALETARTAMRLLFMLGMSMQLGAAFTRMVRQY